MDPTTGTNAGGSVPTVPPATHTISRTTITPSPGQADPTRAANENKMSFRDRLRASNRNNLEPAQEPYPYTHMLRFAMATLMGVLCLLTVGGAILMLLLWQQDRASGVLTSQLERTWDLFDILREVERWVALAIVVLAVAWIALAAINARRATGQRRNPIIAAASLPVGLFGVWIVGAQIVAEADDWITEAAGMILQAILLAIPLLALERVAEAAEARHRPLRATYVLGVVYLIVVQTLGGLSTIEATTDSDRWGKLGAYLVIGALIMVLGTLSANEAARSIEEGSEHRYQLRHKFGEALLAQSTTH